ncbi:hypothetical protein AZ46_0216680 [Metabacillus indicus LMG 22858]|nr:hypothetical protein AZ46_0216680 [Metabacillus indicus LMG 22858]
MYNGIFSLLPALTLLDEAAQVKKKETNAYPSPKQIHIQSNQQNKLIDLHMAVLEKKYSLVYLTPSKPKPSLRSVFRFFLFRMNCMHQKDLLQSPGLFSALKKGSKKKTPVKAVF